MTLVLMIYATYNLMHVENVLLDVVYANYTVISEPQSELMFQSSVWDGERDLKTASQLWARRHARAATHNSTTTTAITHAAPSHAATAYTLYASVIQIVRPHLWTQVGEMWVAGGGFI